MDDLELNINNEIHTVQTDPETPLLFVLRNQLKLFGAKLGCGLEQCGACAVLVDGEMHFSCTLRSVDAVNKRVVTVEGLARDGQLNAVQRAFVEHGAAQCGYCTAGLLVSATALLQSDPTPDESAIRTALEPHLCRCGSHARVLAAVRACAGAA